MKKGNITYPYYIVEFKEHLNFKDKILNIIEGINLPFHSNENGIIKKTDYFIEDKLNKPYADLLESELQKVINEVVGIRYKFDKVSCWFQQYDKYNTHSWHNHGLASWACVYYVELDTKAPATQFKSFDNNEIKLNVKEGDILFFPGFLLHRSPPNLSIKRKTVIAFNLFE